MKLENTNKVQTPLELMTFREFCNKMNEVGDRPYDIKWTKSHKQLVGIFHVEEHEIKIKADVLNSYGDLDVYQFKFYRDESTNMPNDKTKGKFNFIIMSTIRVAIEYVIKELNPRVLVFAAVDNSGARKALYKLEASRLANKFGYLDLTTPEALKKFFPDFYEDDFLFGIYTDESDLKQINKHFED